MPDTQTILDTALKAIEDIKAENTVVMPVGDFTTITDYMVVTTGNSSQHVRAISRNLREAVKKANIDIFGFEGEDQAEWVLADLGDVVVHIMRPEIREYYQIEKLWSVEDADSVAGA